MKKFYNTPQVRHLTTMEVFDLILLENKAVLLYLKTA